MPTLTLTQIAENGDAARTCSISKEQILFGKTADCDVIVAHPHCSRRHCLIIYVDEPPGWAISDTFPDGSRPTNGVTINGQRLLDVHRLADLDRIVLGGAVEFIYHATEALPRAATAPDQLHSECTYTWIDDVPSNVADLPPTLKANDDVDLQRLRQARLDRCPVGKIVLLVQDTFNLMKAINPFSNIDEEEQRLAEQFVSGLQNLLGRFSNQSRELSNAVLEFCRGSHGGGIDDDQTQEAMRTRLTVTTRRNNRYVSIAPLIFGDALPPAWLRRVTEHAETQHVDLISLAATLAGPNYLLCLRKLNDIRHMNAAGGLIGRSAVMQQLKADIGKVASTSVPILLLGESGVGKEVVAKLIWEASGRGEKDGRFLALNCAAIPDSLAESELFGHCKGAFTDATHERKGHFELAHRGTLFLDEVGDMPTPQQAKLLRVLQEKKFTRLGDTKEIQVDVRLIAATKRNLNEAIRTGAFRDDLYYRLNVVNFVIPPLRERMEDIEPLAESFLAEFNRKYHRQVLPPTDAALDVLQRHDWPGNVRQLQTLMERIVLWRGDEPGPVTADEVTDEMDKEPIRRTATSAACDIDLTNLQRSQAIHDLTFYRQKIRETGNKKEMLRLLGINPDAYRKRIERFFLDHNDLSEQFADVK